jgi:hypothetical protein
MGWGGEKGRRGEEREKGSVCMCMDYTHILLRKTLNICQDSQCLSSDSNILKYWETKPKQRDQIIQTKIKFARSFKITCVN